MSSVFKTPKVMTIEPEEVVAETADNNEILFELEKRRKKKNGAVSQLMSHNNSYDDGGVYKTTLGR